MPLCHLVSLFVPDFPINNLISNGGIKIRVKLVMGDFVKEGSTITFSIIYGLFIVNISTFNIVTFSFFT